MLLYIFPIPTYFILTKSTKPFILGYSVIANMLLSSAPGKAYLSVCSVTLQAYPTARGKSIDRGIAEEYNQMRPHSSLGYRPPAPEARIPVTLT